MPTALVLGLTALGVLAALALGLVAVFRPQARRAGALAALGLAAASALFVSWGLGLIFRASAPVPGNVLLYGGSFQTVFALTARDATMRWSASVAPAQISGTPVEQDGVVYVSTTSGVDAFSASTGHPLWRSATAIQVEPGSIADGVLYGASIQNGQSPYVAAIDVKDGRQLWQAAAPGLGPAGLASNLLPLGGVVLVGDAQGSVHALDRASGSARWQVAVPQAGPMVWLATGSDGTVYGIAQQEGLVRPALAFALDPQTQALRWRQSFGANASISAALTVASGQVYVGTDSALVTLDAATGSQRWSYRLPSGNGGSAQVVVDQGIVYAGNVGAFSALRASDGKPLWVHSDASFLAFGTPLVSYGVVFTQTTRAGPAPFFALDSGVHVYALRASDGHQFYRH